MSIDRNREIVRTREQIRRQRRWIEEHGSDRVGYIQRYRNYGDGGEAIWQADSNELRALESKLALLAGGRS